MKRLSSLFAIIVMGVLATPVQAYEGKLTSVSRWFFRGENMELQQTCTYRLQSWAGFFNMGRWRKNNDGLGITRTWRKTL